MARRTALLVLTLIGVLTAAAALASGPPPRNLHRVGDHWTAWDPPADAPAGASVHRIEQGDTLWDLSRRFFGDPYLWPQIWELNQYILDAHWIYPGDPLVIEVEVVTPSELAELEPLEGELEEEAADDDEISVLTLEQAQGPPEALGTSSHLYCTGYIEAADKSFGYSITGSEYQALAPRLTPREIAGQDVGVFGQRGAMKYGLATGDIAYVDGGRAAGLSVGQIYSAVEAGDLVRHPVTNEVVGRYYGHLGRLRVVSVQESSAIAEITESCRPIPVGSTLEIFEPEPLPLGRLTETRPATFPSSAESLEDAPVIVYTQNSVVSIGEDQIVFIDRGEGDDVLPGDIFTVYRMNNPGAPPVVLGELAILSVKSHAAVGRVLDSRFPMYVGDRLELK